MSTFVIGDVHGCFRTLERLLDEIEYDSARHRLWLTGDLVNRGSDSLSVLRWARQNEDRLVTVLGNHDLHLIACYHGVRQSKATDTFDEILDAPDVADLIQWLSARPLLHRTGDIALVHAGLLPQWTLSEAEEVARRVCSEFAADPTRLLRGMYGDGRDHAALVEDPKVVLEAALRAFVSVRTCRADGRLCSSFVGPPAEAPDGCTPWFMARKRAGEEQIFFGHWAALGLYLGDGFTGLDTGCAWGGALTAIRLEDRAVYQVSRVE